MATYEYSTDAYAGIGFPDTGKSKSYIVKRTIDLNAASVALKSSAVFADGDIIKVLRIPAQTLVEWVFLSVDTAETLTTAVEVGADTGANSGDADGFLGSTSLATATTTTATMAMSLDNTVGNTSPWSVALAGGHYFHVADTLDLLITTTTTTAHTGVITLTVKMTDLS